MSAIPSAIPPQGALPGAVTISLIPAVVSAAGPGQVPNLKPDETSVSSQLSISSSSQISDSQPEQEKMDVVSEDRTTVKSVPEMPKNAEIEDVLQPVSPETLEALRSRDREIAELRKKMEQLTDVIEGVMASSEACGNEVLLADTELILSLEREVEIRRRLARNNR